MRGGERLTPSPRAARRLAPSAGLAGDAGHGVAEIAQQLGDGLGAAALDEDLGSGDIAGATAAQTIFQVLFDVAQAAGKPGIGIGNRNVGFASRCGWERRVFECMQGIVCVPSDEPLPRGDLLTSRALSGFPGAWLAVPRLREVGLLPAAIGSRSIAAQRAAALRGRRFPCDVIARWLDAEGYAAPNTDPGHWTRKDVLTLLREGRSLQPTPLPDVPLGAPAALL